MIYLNVVPKSLFHKRLKSHTSKVPAFKRIHDVSFYSDLLYVIYLLTINFIKYVIIYVIPGHPSKRIMFISRWTNKCLQYPRDSVNAISKQIHFDQAMEEVYQAKSSMTYVIKRKIIL